MTIHRSHRPRAAAVLLALLVPPAAAFPAELVTNGDFEAGNRGFTSLYSFGDNDPAQSYTVGTNPAAAPGRFDDWQAFGDHTSGAGMMMIVNGGMDATAAIWSETVNVVAGRSYAVSFWGATINTTSGNNGALQFRVNGADVGAPLALPGTGGTFVHGTGSWVADAATARLEIVDLNASVAYNDLVLDDVSFTDAPSTSPSSAAAAVDFGSLGGGSDVNQGAFSMGYRFQPTRDVQVATLGYYDDGKNGFKQSHGVVIFDAVTKAIVINSQVTNADPLRGFFRYHAVAPVTLSATREYFLMGDNSADNYARDVTGLSVNPAVALKGGAFNPNPPTLGPDFPTQTDAGTPFFGPTFEIVGAAHPDFFKGEVALGNNTYYLNLPDGTPFGYYGYLPQDQNYISHQDLGYEYVTDAKDGKSGVYLYDFASQGFFYTSPAFPFPYLYDFSLHTVLYYYPDPNNPGRYNTNGTRYFYRFDTGAIFSK